MEWKSPRLSSSGSGSAMLQPGRANLPWPGPMAQLRKTENGAESHHQGVADSPLPLTIQKAHKRGRKGGFSEASVVGGSGLVREREGERGGRWDIKPRSLMADREAAMAVPRTAAWRSRRGKPPVCFPPTRGYTINSTTYIKRDVLRWSLDTIFRQQPSGSYVKILPRCSGTEIRVWPTFLNGRFVPPLQSASPSEGLLKVKKTNTKCLFVYSLIFYFLFSDVNPDV